MNAGSSVKWQLVFFGVPALRDVSQAEFDAKAEALGLVVFRRARHVIIENI